MISVSHVSKMFGSTQAVDDLSFTIKKGEIVGFLGPNGAGKTTTMRMLTGFLTQDAGEISIDDIPVDTNPTAAQRQIGYLPENNPLYKDMLVGELLQFSANLKQIPKDKQPEAFKFVVDAVDIADVFYRPIGELSKGYKQRVGIALALLHQPPIIIMDEPTEGLDPNQRTEIRSLIKKLAKDHTIIMSTHVMQEAQAVANRLIIISEGKLVADGTPAQLTKKAKHAKRLILEIEGAHIKKALGTLKSVTINALKEYKEKTHIELTSTDTKPLQPEIAKLAHTHKWIIWKLAEEEHDLEEVFHELTR